MISTRRILKLVRASVLVFFITIISICCNRVQTFRTVDIVKSDSLIIEFPFLINEPPYNWSFSKFNDTLYGLFSFWERKSICLVNMETMEFRSEISLNHILKDYDNHFQFVHFDNSDSIVILYLRDQPIYSNDSLITFIDIGGNIIDVVGLSKYKEYSSLINSQKEVNYSLQKREELGFNWQNPAIVEDEFYLPNGMLFYEPGDTLFSKINPSAGVSISFFNNDIVLEKPDLFYPVQIGNTFERDLSDPDILATNDSMLVYAFDYSNILYLFNRKSKQYSSRYNLPRLLDSISPLTSFQSCIDRPNKDLSKPYYKDVFYSPDQKMTIRTAFIGTGDSSLSSKNAYDFLWQNQWIGAYDEGLGLVAENYYHGPLALSFPVPQSYGNNLYAVSNEAKYPSNQLSVYIINLILKNTPNFDRELMIKPVVKSQIKGETTFIKDFKLDKASFVLLIPEASCHYCVPQTLNYYLANINSFNSKNVKIVIDDQDLASEYYSQIDSICGFEVSCQIQIAKGERKMNNYFDSNLRNPTLLKIENGRFTQRIQLNPDKSYDILSLIDKLLE